MKFVTSISSNNTNVPVDLPVDYIYVESPEIVKQGYVINIVKHSSPCDNCLNNPTVNKFATGVYSCTLNLPDIY